jgi:hypothetical protein
MKKVTIGRGYDCDIIIGDDTDRVSRRQAVIVTGFFGQMRIYDVSINGTYVNGILVPKPDGMILRKTDKVNFCQIWEFDWSTWKDPYRKLKQLLAWLALSLLILVCISIFWIQNDDRTPAKDQKIIKEESLQPAHVDDATETGTVDASTVNKRGESSLPKKKTISRATVKISEKEKSDGSLDEKDTMKIAAPFFF